MGWLELLQWNSLLESETFLDIGTFHHCAMCNLPPAEMVSSGLFAFSFYEGHGSTSASSAKAKTLDVLKIEEGQGGVNFSIKGTDEVVLLIEDPQSGLKFKMALGAQENSVTYLSLLSKGK